MAGEDKTAALVVALSAQLTKFERDMKQAGDIADRTVSGIEDRFSKANPTFAGSFLGNFLANLASRGLDTAIKLVSDLVDRFVDLDKVSRLVQVSMNDLFGLQQAATQFKVPIDEANASIRQLAVLLNQMQRGEKNTLTDLFDANPNALKGINRDALTLQQTFAVVEKIIQNAFNPLDKVDLGKFAGQTEAMSLALGKSGQSFTLIAQKASETAPDLQKMADGAKQFDEFVANASKNLKAFFAQQTVDFFKSSIQDIQLLTDLSIKFLSLFKSGPLDEVTTAASQRLEQFRQSISGSVSEEEKPKRIIITGGSRAGKSIVPAKTTGGGDTLDSFDRTEESITRHTASVNADTIAVSQNSAVQAQLRAEFQLLNAIRKDEGEVTQGQIDQYTKLRETMSAQQALVAAGIQLNADHAKSFIAVSEGAGAAQAAYTKAADGVAKLNSASQQIGSALSTAFADAVVEGKNLNDVFTSLLKTLEKAAINSIFSSLFNQQTGGGLSPFASLLKGVIPGFASGTNFAPGGAAWVGENGPELVNLPRGSQVIPNAVSSRSGGGVVVNLVEDSSRAGQVHKNDDGAGGFDVTAFVDAITAKNAANPGSATSQVLNNRRRVASR